MNPRIPYNPKKRRSAARPPDKPERDGLGCARFLWLLMPVVMVGAVWMWRSRAAAQELPSLTTATATRPPVVTLTPNPAETQAASPAPITVAPATQGIVTLTPLPTVLPPTIAATIIVLPTSTLLPEPSPSPTALTTPSGVEGTVRYEIQSGDTLEALAARFGVNPADIQSPVVLPPNTMLSSGQALVIPNILGEVGPGYHILPDSEVVFSGSAAGFDPQEFAEQRGGYLGEYVGYADDRAAPGGDVLLVAARDHSINPRLLMALLEYISGWVLNPDPQGEALRHPFGYDHQYLTNLNAQLTWATTQLGIGYYGWREGSLTELHFKDGTSLRLNPSLNAGTVAVQHLLAQVFDRADWQVAVSPEGFATTYRALFGDPAARDLDPLLPGNLTQPFMALPYAVGTTWSLSGGPHGAWELGGAQAALDFAPSSAAPGCVASAAWVTAMAAGLVTRSANGVVVVDLDGDGSEATGWVIMYLHIATQGRAALGTLVELGDRIGHPSCEGGRSTGTHVHVARKFNGEWITAYGPVPFNLSGWVAGRGKGEYYGTLTRNGVVVEACTCTAAWTAVKHEP